MQHDDLAKRKSDCLEQEEAKIAIIASTYATASREDPSSSFTGVPNSKLSEEEKEAKRRLKKRLRIQVKVQSLQNSIRHAQARKDGATEKNQRNKLDELLEKEYEIFQEMQLDSDPSSKSSNSYSLTDLKEKARPFVEDISKALFDSQAARDALGENINKEIQSSNAVKLLKHMTKGTQELSMFQDKAALWGYTRRKFYERAVLLCASLGRIQLPCQEPMKGSPLDPKLCEQQQIRQKVWYMLTSDKVRKVCSIGCGPGNDLVGLLSFLHMHIADGTNVLDKALLMDWSINEWKEAIIDPLNDILERKGFLNGIDTVFCDVTKDINDDGSNNALHQDQLDFDLYSISYLLSETRGKWVSFFKALVSNAKPGAMFYFAEPIPWQLHRFIEFFKGELQFIWLDSSMDHPMFQKADRRAGPSVLFAIKEEAGRK